MTSEFCKVGPMCSIEGCAGQPVAKGLCSKHYMRVRRTGNSLMTRKPGPTSSKTSLMLTTLFPDWSASRCSRYKLAMALCPNLEERNRVIGAATRPNGSLNVRKLLDMAAIAFALSLSVPEEEQEPTDVERVG